MARKKVVDIDGLLVANPEYFEALLKGEQWAVDHMSMCESLNRGEPEGYRRKFDGKAHKWCGESCPFPEGCMMCTLPDDPEMARLNRKIRNDPMRLSPEGVVTIDGPIDYLMASRVREMIETAEAHRVKELVVRIRTKGGDSGAGLEIHDLIRAASVQKRVGIVDEYALSMGTIILQSCDWREAAPRARLLLHHSRFQEITVETLKDPEKVRSMLASCEPSERRIDDILIRRTGRTLAEIKTVCDQDTEMAAREALQFGLIDAIRKQ